MSSENIFIPSFHKFNMKPQKLLGISFILLALIVSVSNISITGAVIGSSLSNYFSFITLVLFIGGIGLLMAGREAKEGNLAELASDSEISSALKKEGIAGYIPRTEKLEIISDTLGGYEKFYIPSIKNGDTIYVHITKKKAAKSIIRKGGRLKHGGISTYGQAFIFTGKDALNKSKIFIDSLSKKGKYVGVTNPTNAIIFKTDIVPTLNRLSSRIRNYPGDWKAMWDHDIPRSLMYDVENRSIAA